MEKQLLFDFMNVVEIIALDYVGGQDEELGGYCEPLIVKYRDSSEDYVLHQMYQTDSGEQGIKNNHLKIKFYGLDELINGWNDVWSLCMLNNAWEKTDEVCGYGVSSDEFYKTKRLAAQLNHNNP